MRSTIHAIIFALAAIPVDSAILATPMPGHTVSGIVGITGSLSTPPVVRIQLQEVGRTIREVVLRENRFEFFNVEEGSYTLIVEAPGYEKALREINVPGAWSVIDLRLRRNAAQPAEALSVRDARIPKSARRQFEAARRNLRKNNCADALGHLKKAVRTYADYGDAHKAIGQCYAEMNQLETAEQEYKLALEQPHSPELHILLGRIYAREDNVALLARQLELFVEEKPNR